MDIRSVAKHHCDIFRFHDDKDWQRLNDAAAGCAMALGYEGDVAKDAASHIADAYRYSDEAPVAQRSGNRELEDSAYNRSFLELKQAYSLLWLNPRCALYKVRWWRGVRHRNVPAIAWNLFMEQYAKFGPSRLGLAMYGAYVATAKVYPAHAEHDWPRLTEALEKYWKAIAKSYSGNARLPMEF